MNDRLISRVRPGDVIQWAGSWCRVIDYEQVQTGWDDRFEGRWLTIKPPICSPRRVYYLDNERVAIGETPVDRVDP